MGAALKIFNLYEVDGLQDLRHMIVRAPRPAFSNANQPEEDLARAEVAATFKIAVALERQQLGFSAARQVATWEDGLPEGDAFYGDGPPERYDVWITLDTKHQIYFAFGSEPTEAQFWADLKELYDEGDLWGFEEFRRPAIRTTAWFLPAVDEAAVAQANARVAMEIHRSIDAAPLSIGELRVAVASGVAYLSGVAKMTHDIERAMTIAKSHPSIRRVQHAMTVLW